MEAPTADEMQAIIRRFDRAPLEDKLLRANPAQPSKGKGQPTTNATSSNAGHSGSNGTGRPQGRDGAGAQRRSRPKRDRDNEPKSAFAAELAKAL